MAQEFETTPEDTATFWDRRAPTAAFNHPLPRYDLERLAPESAQQRILDVGCGYGRMLRELYEAGYRHLTGIDVAPAMLERARAHLPEQVALRRVSGTDWPFSGQSFDVVLFITTFTSAPALATQQALVAEARRVLVPGGLVFVSDLMLQDDERNGLRYAEGEARFGEEGVFSTSDGGVFRHHQEGWFDRLFQAFELLKREPFEGVTMNGHPARLTRMWFRSPGSTPR